MLPIVMIIVLRSSNHAGNSNDKLLLAGATPLAGSRRSGAGLWQDSMSCYVFCFCSMPGFCKLLTNHRIAGWSSQDTLPHSTRID